MTNQIEVKIQVIVHATEDLGRIFDSLTSIFNLNSDDFDTQDLTGHFENPIKMISVTVRKKHAEKFVSTLFSKMKKSDMRLISEELENRTNESGLKIRISKQKLILGKVVLENNNAIKILITIPVYIKKNFVNIYRETLKIS